MAFLLVVTVAYATDQTIRGSSLIVKNPSTPDKRKITAKAKEVGSNDAIVGNPATNGATLTITANGGTPSSGTHNLPAGTSPLTLKPFWSGDVVKGFKYNDVKGENGPVKGTQIKKTGSGVFMIKLALPDLLWVS